MQHQKTKGLRYLYRYHTYRETNQIKFIKQKDHKATYIASNNNS